MSWRGKSAARSWGLLLALASMLWVPSHAMVARSTEADLPAETGLAFAVTGEEIDVPVCRQARDLVSNPGFEQGIGQSNHWPDDGACSFAAVSPGHGAGTLSAQISSASVTKKNCALYSPVEEIGVEPGRAYHYAAWIKTDLVQGNAYLAVSFWYRLGTWKLLREARTRLVSDTGGGWIQVTGVESAPVDAEYARVEVVLSSGSQGSVWADDVFLGLATCLQLGQVVYPDPAELGQTLNYTVVYTNAGHESATDVAVFELYDDCVLFQQANPAPMSGTTTVWSLGTLAAGTSGQISITTALADCAQQRANLWNTVQIASDELLAPVSAVITTEVTPMPYSCDVSLSPHQQAGMALPGSAAQYTLMLRNSGSRDGHVYIDSLSTLGAGIAFDHPDDFQLQAGDAKEVGVSVTLPGMVQASTSDTSWVTATLECGPSDPASSTMTSALLTSVRSEVSLPLALRNYRGSELWEVEPNYPCPLANGPLQFGREYNGFPDDLWDLFSVDVPVRGTLTAHLTIYTGEGVQLQVVDGNCGPIDDRYVYHAPYEISYTLDPGRYHVAIYTTEERQNITTPYITWVTLQ